MAESSEMPTSLSEVPPELRGIIQEIISLERLYYFEKKNVKTERQRKLKEIIERHSQDPEEE